MYLWGYHPDSAWTFPGMKNLLHGKDNTTDFGKVANIEILFVSLNKKGLEGY